LNHQCHQVHQKRQKQRQVYFRVQILSFFVLGALGELGGEIVSGRSFE